MYVRTEKQRRLRRQASSPTVQHCRQLKHLPSILDIRYMQWSITANPTYDILLLFRIFTLVLKEELTYHTLYQLIYVIISFDYIYLHRQMSSIIHQLHLKIVYSLFIDSKTSSVMNRAIIPRLSCSGNVTRMHWLNSLNVTQSDSSIF
jgi:hypothetical protein